MREVVRLLQLPKGFYNPAKYPNPSLQWHYSILQAMALEEDIPEEPDDQTIPKYKQIEKRVGEFLGGWKEVLAHNASGLMHTKALKRESTVDRDERPAKRAKATPAATKPSGSLSNAQLKAAIEQDTLKKLTVMELKEILTSKGISTAGKKADLLEKVEQWVEENV
jgi:ATP-dependent DNA helicase 2 subunit 1